MAGLILQYLRKCPIDYGKAAIAKRIDLSKVRSPYLYTNSMGIQFELHLEEYLMKQIYLYDLYERNSVRYLKKMVKEGAICIDGGANSGFYSLTFARLAGEKGQVHAFEPVSINFDRFKKNASLNRFPQLTLNQVGLSDEAKSMEIHFGGNNLGTASLYTQDKGKTETIPLRTLDSYCEEKGIEQIDFLKIDVEGAELECLKGAQEVIRRSPNLVLIMEIMDANCQRAGYSAEELFQFVTDLGFRGYIPKSWPFGLKPITEMPKDYLDNIFFLRNSQP